MRPSSTVKQFLKYVLATASSSAFAMLGTLAVARALGAEGFVTVNLVVVCANVLSQLSAGSDSAAARQLRSGHLSVDAALMLATRWRIPLSVAAIPVSVAVFTISSNLRIIEFFLVVTATLLNSIALSLVAISLVVPQAQGDVFRLGTLQFLYYVPFFLSCLLCFWFKSVSSAAILLCLSALMTIIFIGRLQFTLWKLRLEHSTFFGPKSFRVLSSSLICSGVLYTVGERIDVVLVAAKFPYEVAANYALSVRLCGLMAVVVGAVQAMSISTLGGISSVRRLQAQVLRQWPIAAIIMLAVLVLAWASVNLDTVVFGAEYQVSFTAIIFLGLPFVCYSLYSPYVLAMANLGFYRFLAIISVAGLMGKVLTVALALILKSIDVLYLSNLAGSASSLAVILLSIQRHGSTAVGTRGSQVVEEFDQ